MNHAMLSRAALGSVLVAVLSLATSCTSVERKAAAAEGPRVLLDETQYEKIYVTGSNLPVLVPKSSTARPLPSISPVTSVSGDSFRDAVRPGRAPARR